MTRNEKDIALVTLQTRLESEGCGIRQIVQCLVYESRVLDLESEGIDRSDAQGIAEAEGLGTLELTQGE